MRIRVRQRRAEPVPLIRVREIVFDLFQQRLSVHIGYGTQGVPTTFVLTQRFQPISEPPATLIDRPVR